MSAKSIQPFSLSIQSLACSRLRNSGEKSFSKKKCEKRAGAGERQGGSLPVFSPPPSPFPNFPSRAPSYFRFARFNTSALNYLRAWHRLYSLQWSDHVKGKSRFKKGKSSEYSYKAILKGSLVWCEKNNSSKFYGYIGMKKIINKLP